MGIYFNPGNEGFRVSSQSEIYMDKSGLIEHTNRVVGTEQNCISLSHARRFGKSQAARMLEAFYSRGCDSRELFACLNIGQAKDWDKSLNKYNVIHLDMSTFAGNHKEDLVNYVTSTICMELQEALPDVHFSADIANMLSQAYISSGIKFVIIIDEWDCVVRNHADRQDLVHRYMQFLHDLFKSEESKSFLALGYITGILPIKKIQDESALNNFSEYTMVSSKHLTTYYGFTESEVRGLCDRFQMNFESIKTWYNGYLIDGQHMYNPNSVYRAMLDQSVESYWKNTSAFSTINKLITLNFDGLKDDILKMLAGGKAEVKTGNFQNDLIEIHSKDDALTALVHLGYLAYDAAEGEAYLPNFEVARAYESALETGSWHEVAQSIAKCDSLLKATIRGQADKVAELIDLAHETYTSVLKYNDENSLSCVLTMAYFTAPAYYNVVREFPAGKGFADMVFVPRREAENKPAIIVELKYDKNVDTAIRQIKEKRYTGCLAGYSDKIMLVGISYDKETKQHECVIEECWL